MKFKTLYYSKNNDKLNTWLSKFNYSIKWILKHTNRLFLNKDRIKNKSKLFLEQNKSNQRNIFKNINHSKS